MSTNYSEQIFQSIDTIISLRLNEVSFDKTEICEIISLDKVNKNKYWVSNGSLKYEAYSTDENRKYLANQKVYVTIPQGNYDLRKLIIGSYSTDESNENLYVNPFNHLVTSSSHKVSNITITANTSGNSTSDFKDLEIRFNYSNTINFDYIGLEFGLDTSSLQDTYKGTYSIELLIYNNEDKQLNTSRIILYNTDLYGNPYGLIPILKFLHLFPFPKEIKKITDIAKIRVLLAQDGNFEKEGNIKLQDIKLYFGYDTKTITKYELSLILEEGQNLKYTTEETATARTLYLDWKHFDASNTPYIFNIYQSPNIFDYYKVYWLHYVDGLGKNTDLPDEYAWNWKTITLNINLKQDIILTTLYRTDQYKVVIEYKYKNNETIYYAESTGLVFDNTNVAAEPGATNGSEDSLRIKLNEGDTGVYNIYGLDGRMMDYSYRGPHNIYFEFLDTTPLDRIASINWEFPSENTMIKDAADTDKRQATFNIDTMYKPGAMNNRIWCTVTLVTGEIRRGSLTLLFGEAAAAGSNYAFNIDFKGHRTCLYATGKEDSVEIQAIFTKQNGEVMTVPTITWSWMNDYNSPITLSRTTGESITLTYNNSKVPKENYSILQAKINDYAIDNGLTTNLTAYLPISIAKPEYNYISGATRVVYDSNGNTATYSRNPYELYNLTKKIENTSWDIISNSTNDTFLLKTLNIRDKNGNIIGEEKTLLPLSYIPQKPPMTCVYCILNGNIVWSLPILIMQNRWEYDLLNEWNGKLNINDLQGYMLAPLLGAGKKEDNGFTGVIMGDLKLAKGSVTNTGLYGFKEGSRRFSFNDKGEAYIGTGDYYINFDSENLTIKAKNFDLNANNGALIINNREGIKLGSKISINPDGTAKIGGWIIDTAKLYTPSIWGVNGFERWGTGIAATGWEIDPAFYAGFNGNRGNPWAHEANLDSNGNIINGPWYDHTNFYVTNAGFLKAKNADISGTITANNGKIADYVISGAQLIGNNVGLSGTSGQGWAFWAGSNDSNSAPFRVGHDGSLHATQANIIGTITAINGFIGGWTIDSNKLYTPSVWGLSGFEKYGTGMAATGVDYDPAFYAGFRGNGGNPWSHDTMEDSGEHNDGPWYDHTNFYVTNSGFLRAKNAEITGTINANNGKIGGWTIDSYKIYTPSVWDSNGIAIWGTGMAKSGVADDPAFYAGFRGNGGDPWSHDTMEDSGEHNDGPWYDHTNFYVTNSGFLRAKNADISGTITAKEGGKIGNWYIGTDYLQGAWVGSNGKTNYVKIKVPDDTTDNTFLDVKYNGTFPFVVTKTGHLTATDATIAGWTIDSNRIYKGNTELSSASGATRIKTDSIEINGGSMNINNTFLINTAGRVSIVKTINGNVKSGYFTYGGTVTDHPYVSALNVAWFGTGSTDGGISFRNSADIDDAGSEIAHILCNSSRMMMVNHDNSINIEAGDSCSIDASDKGYIRISAGNKNAASKKNPGSVYVVGAAHINLVAGQGHHVYAGANGWNNGNNSLIETEAGTISSRSTKANITITNDKFYNDALQLLQNMKLYTYNYKYDLYSNKAQYGFIIDEIESLDKLHHFLDIHEQMAWTRGRYIDFCMDNMPKDDLEVSIVAVKSYNRDAFTKYLLTCTKALYNKILVLEQEIKELKNEI